MPQMITYGSELIRINPSNNKIEYSTNRGSSWITRYSGSGCGQFRDLLEYGNEIIACTDNQDGGRELLGSSNDGHLYYSTNKGSSWIRRR